MNPLFSHHLVSVVGAEHPARIPTSACLPKIDLKSHPQPTVFLHTSSAPQRKISPTCQSPGPVPTPHLD